MRRTIMLALTAGMVLLLSISYLPSGIEHGFAATPAPTTTPQRFANFTVGPVDTSATLAPYTVSQDLANVVVTSALSSEQQDYLRRNAFFVSPGMQKEFYPVYELARYAYEPLLITTDSLLHSFHLIFDKVLRDAEEKHFMPLLVQINAAALARADAEYQALKGTDWASAAQRTVAYIGVAAKLANPKAVVPAYAQANVTAELALINAAAGIQPSVIFPELDGGEDYSQYIPRGHYTKSDTLKAYFKSMMWYGRLTFRLSKPEETKSALLLVQAVRSMKVNGKPGLDAWSELYTPTVFFVGRSDALTIPQYAAVMDQVYGPKADLKAIQAKGIDAFVSAAQALPEPKILNAVISDTDNISQATKGLRFMGQRFVWDAYVFRQLIYRNVGTRDKPRALPMALDVYAALGSDRAKQLLDTAGASAFDHYNDQLAKVKGEVGALQEADWTETLYGTWLYTVNAVNQPISKGYPSFMLNTAYQDRSLYAALGSFTELKHDTILYAEQAYAEMGGGGGKSPPPEPVAPLNYVEPVPLFWARLAALAEMTRQGLGGQKLLEDQDDQTLTTLASYARRFQQDSQLELKGQPLSSDEQTALRFYGGDLERLYGATIEPLVQNGQEIPGAPAEPNAALVTDVATDPQSQKVLELGTGRIYEIYAVVPYADNKLRLAHGAVFSYYEFPQPLSNRLTDEAWQKLLADGKQPALPAWASSFISKSSVDELLSSAIRNFQGLFVSVLWSDPASAYKDSSANKDPINKFFAAQLQPLVKAKQYEGRQIVETNFRSFDMKDANTAIVTTRETWNGELHTDLGPTQDGPKVGERGPYTIDVTYTLTKQSAEQGGGWVVTNVVINGAPPPWKTVK